MTILKRMLMSAFLPVLGTTTAFFALILLLVDLQPKVQSFVVHGVSAAQILSIAGLYIPTAIRYAVPIGLLFSITYTLGTIHARNELIAILGSGMGLRNFMSPLLLTGLIACPALLLFDEVIGTPALRSYNERYGEAVGRSLSLSNSNVTAINDGGQVVYRAEYYSDRDLVLRGLVIVEREADGRLASRVDAARAEWVVDRWMLYDVRRYRWNQTGGFLIQERFSKLIDNRMDGPDVFRDEAREVETMTIREGLAWVRTLRIAGLPYRSARTDVYSKVGYAITPLVVSVIVTAIGGLLRRNVLLARMLIALGGVAGYLILQMVAHILAKSAVISPILGVSLSALVSLVLGTALLQRVRT